MSNQIDSLLIDETKDALKETAQLIEAAANANGEEATALYAKIAENLRTAKHRLVELEGNALEKAKVAAKQTDEYVHTHPWQAVGIGAAVGLLVGFLVARR
ncbi:DUF883 domain-containing protein [Chitinibacter bivalviorum]|uniref:DUF883 domain-containing protein n=1 Tax=Chitinibacter bivalviorum TaxID=2739434 RepID=A0A7H9BFG6_9NEIS|nr:DUF883 family protein [Chitinibacter bivalviorum]QLG87315.1 DUF883 domain-containing protein [Chitinibacter bivalviorum]